MVQKRDSKIHTLPLMMHKKQHILIICIAFFILLFAACKDQKKEPALFEALDENTTGLHFKNTLTSTAQFNLFKYMYFYNGGGIGAGDFNNDGLVDLFFAGNQTNNKLYLNKGNLQFDDVTEAANIPRDSGWSTGVSVADINNDGMLDIYICRVGKLKGLPESHNQLLICKEIDKNHVPHYEDKSHELGLDFSGFSTQAVFFDYDNDGDLDMYLLNHTIHDNGTFGPRAEMVKSYNPLSGDRLYQNDGGKFKDVTAQAGITSSVIGYGLGVVVSDVNLDGYPDIYVGNDFHENDYLYINQRNGTFKESITEMTAHTSQFSMGVDAADISNDGYPEIISMDMLPSDPYILRRSLGEDEFDIFYHKIEFGYHYQFTRNNLQYNRRNGSFSEAGLYAGVAATDWSWAPLWMDFDNDGRKDLFVSNGIPKRMNDIDYINYVSNGEVQEKIRSNKMEETDMALIDKFPQIKIPNKFYSNTGKLVFADIGNQVDNNKPSFSNGAVYADLDNDGDLDIVVNNIDDAALIYRNTSNDKKDRPYVAVKLTGPAGNINAVGARIIVFANDSIRTYEKFPVRGFLSSMEIPVHVGLVNTKPDSVLLVWPDNTYERLLLESNNNLSVKYKTNLPLFDYNIITGYYKTTTLPMEDITAAVGLHFLHKENNFHEFDREPLMPHMLSTEGPALSVADINGDGLDDVFVGSSKWEKSAVFVQQAPGKFTRLQQPSLDADSTYEDVDGCWVDVNNDGKTDLVVASGGNEFFGQDKKLSPRVYINDGASHLSVLEHAFDSIFVNASCIVPYDFNNDGAIDLFVGGRSVPAEYGTVPRSYLLQNNGKGIFTDVTAAHAAGLANIGFVTQAQWVDLDNDGDKDLILSMEWNGITAFINNGGHFTSKVITDKKGWWNFVLPVDIDNDGDMDFIAGNLGLNNRFNCSSKEPVKLYYNDFDGNGTKEQVLTYYLQGKEIPFASKAKLDKQIPLLKKKFLYAEDFAKASLTDLFTKEKLEASNVMIADYFANAVLINKGNLQFDIQALPWEAQLSTYRDAAVVYANNDSLPDILLAGNFYDNSIEMGRADADAGTLLINKGKGIFAAEVVKGLRIKGQVRHIRPIKIGGQSALILARNNDSVMIIKPFSQSLAPISKTNKKH